MMWIAGQPEVFSDINISRIGTSARDCNISDRGPPDILSKISVTLSAAGRASYSSFAVPESMCSLEI